MNLADGVGVEEYDGGVVERVVVVGVVEAGGGVCIDTRACDVEGGGDEGIASRTVRLVLVTS